MATIPLEIIESVIDILATKTDYESFSSIKACSLASRSLLPRTRKYIFRSVTINRHYKDRYNTYTKNTDNPFCRLILGTPEIAQYVVSLRYFANPVDLEIAGFATALSKLTRLESLGISAGPIHWKGLPYKEIILNLMHLPTLNHLKVFDTEGFCLSDLTLCANLKSLEMDNLGRVEGGKSIEAYQEQPPSLESFVYGKENNSWHALRELYTACRPDGKPIVNISELKQLSLPCAQLMDVSFFESEYQFTVGFANLALHSIRTLKYVHIDTSFTANEDWDDTFPLLVSEFASLTGKTIIESICISINILGNFGRTIDDSWCALDQVFRESKSGWGKLKTFSIDVAVDFDGFDEFGGWFMCYLQELPETCLKGIASNSDIIFHFNVVRVRFRERSTV